MEATDARVMEPAAEAGCLAGGGENAEAALRASEARHRQILDCAADYAIIATDLAGRVTRWNRGAERILRWSEAEMLGNPLHRCFTPDDVDAGEPEAEMRLALAQGRASDERWHVRQTGERFWADGEMSPLRDEAGRAVGFVKVLRDRTEQLLAAQALSESEARFRLIADSAPVPMWVTRLDRKREFVNRAYTEFFGISYADALEFDWRRRLHPDDFDRVRAEQAEKSASLGPISLEFRFLTGTGEWRWVRSESQPRWDAEGRHAGFIGVSYDITLAKQAAIEMQDQVVKRTRERDQLWELSEDLLAVADYEGRLLRVSPSWTRLLGHDEPTLLSRPASEILHPDDVDAVVGTVQAMRASGRSVRVECRVRTADGGWRWVAWTLSPDPDRDRLTGVGRDIGAERAAAELLRASEARLRAMFETSYQYQGLLALDGTVLEANQTALAGLGATWHEVVGLPFWDTGWFSATPGMPDAIRADVAAAAEGHLVRREIQVNLPGGWRSFDFTLRPMRDEGGAVIALVPEAVETTERRQAEEALRQSQKLEAMGQLTGGVAHDFNNLLTPIIGGLDMLQRRSVDGTREKRLIDGALQSAERARTLVQRLLAFARRQPIQPVPVDLASLVAGMADLVASTAGPQIELVTDLPPDLPLAQADPHQLEMAILNLSVNARDAMPDGGSLRIAARPEAVGPQHRLKLYPGSYVVLSVADTGIGMDAATLARAIEPFFSTKGIGKGTGLGLSMAHGLASQLGGALDIGSAPGRGTTVELWLPVSARSGRPVERQTDATTLAVGGLGTALLVDDEDIVRMSTADMLVELGYRVVEASSAAEALAAIDSGVAVDVLVTDHLMPGMTGAELARVFRTRRPGTPVLIVSGYAEVDGIAPDLARLSKPFRQADLAAALSRLAVMSRAAPSP